MKKKILGVSLLTILLLSSAPIALAEETQQANDDQTVETTTNSDSTTDTSSAATKTTESNSSTEAGENVEAEEETVVPETQIDTAEGTMSLPKGRSDLYPTRSSYLHHYHLFRRQIRIHQVKVSLIYLPITETFLLRTFKK